MDDDYNKIMSILGQNMNKNFVQRILTPDLYPKLDFGDGESFGTHLMSWSTVNNKPIVYPLIVYDEKNKSLVKLEGDEAINHALKNGEFISFNNDRDADWFSQNYKKVWEK